MKSQKLSNQEINRKKSMKVSLFLHASIILLGLIPFTQQQLMQEEDDVINVVTLEFAEFASMSEGLQARSAKVIEEVKPVTDNPNENRGTESVEPSEDLVPVTEQEDLESEVIEEEVQEVNASDDAEIVENEDAAAKGGFEASNAEGDAEGSAAEGNDNGSNGIDGDGIITRRIVHREDIGKAAVENGKIVVNLCIDRQGRVVELKNNAEETTISNTALIRKALDIASGYRFEKDYNAAYRECGRLTFIFDIEGSKAQGIIAMNE